MKNAFRIFWRDVKRIAKVPPAWLIVIFLCLLPSLYAWFNIAGFWDPYNNTENLRVCVVNEDTGVNDDVLGDVIFGDDIEDALQSNDSFDWDFTSRDDALEQIRTGEAYAVFIVPDSFSADIASLFSGNLNQPTLEYYVNEKMSPVSPKITDKGADVLDTTINDTFISVVSSVIATYVNDAVDQAHAGAVQLQNSAVTKIEDVQSSVTEAQTALTGLAQAADASQSTISTVRTDLTTAQSTLNQLSSDLAGVSLLATQTSESLVSFLISTGAVLDESSMLISQASIKADGAIGHTSQAVISASSSVSASLSSAQAVISEIEQVIVAMDSIVAQLPEGEGKDNLQAIIDDLKSENSHTQEVVGGLNQLSDDIGASASAIAGASGAINGSVQDALMAADGFRAAFSDDTIPAVSQGIVSMGTSVQALSTIASNQAILVQQALLVVDELSSTLTLSSDALIQTEDILAGFNTSLETLKTDLGALSSSSALASMGEKTNLKPEQIASFMLSPTQVKNQELYPINVYGSAMAPLFINLTLWIGVFMLMVIIRLEVDNTGFRNLTIAQRYFGRGLFLAVLATFQALICCTGCLVIGVQVINIPMFYITAILCSLAYLSIQYSLSATFQHVGKALCIILVFVQIPGATGLYPIEMTPEFFQTVYPLFPFTYGINAIRETTCGFYGHDWLTSMAVLSVFFAASIAIGILTRPYVTNLNRLFAREIKESDLINGETVELPEQHYKRSELIQLLSNREEYRVLIKERAVKFMRIYPRLKRAFCVVAVAVPIVIAVVYALLGIEKVAILTSWLIWVIAVIVATIVIEYFKDHIARQISFDDMSDERIRELYDDRKQIHSQKGGA